MNNEELEAEILDAIQYGRGRLTLSKIVNRVYRHQIALDHPVVHRQWRLVVRRLQSLRKRGSIWYDRGRRAWAIVFPA